MVVLKRKNIVIGGTLILTLITIIVCLFALSFNPISKVEAGIVSIVLDAGHGGVDAGVSGVATGVKESDLNLAVTKKLEKYLTSAGFFVTLTRSTEAGLYGTPTGNKKRKDMEKRREIIKDANPDLVVSIHMNYFSTSSRRGAQVFYEKGDTGGKLLAESLQKAFNGMEKASRNCSILAGDYYVLNTTECPAVIAECGFLSNREDEALLVTEEYQNEIAYTIFSGIVDYLSISSIKFCD